MNLIQISNKLPDELSCIKYAEKLRFGKKAKCAYCNSTNLGERQTDHRHKCKACNKTSSVTIGTHLQGTKMPLKTWIYAVSIITDAKKGLSALQLQRNLDISYPTAFTMYHKIRELMMTENNKNPELTDVVEMDETYIGGKPRKFNNGKTVPPTKKTKIPKLDERIAELKEAGVNFKKGKGNPARSAIKPKRGRGTDNIPVVGIVQRNGNVVAQVMKSLTYDNLKKMVQKNVKEDSSVLVTDEYRGYSKMHTIIEHIKIDHNRLYSYKGVNTNSIESFWAIIERGIMGQYHSVSPKMLPNYVAEFVYKYNNRKDNDSMFYELIERLVKPVKKK